MIVTFHSEAYADIMMFGDVAIQLLKLMGHSGTVPGALLAEDVPEALASLKKAIADDRARVAAPPPKPEGKDDEVDDADREPPVQLAHRALPLIELLAASARAGCNVMWDR
ncbi:MAG: DUF1840 domain-containing protein [Candidatus Contendobacter sp.]|nr:DUF1840 domain-containing protein [Candidatus Contendobacter sp.]MDG4556023.1 DUF1840 domain-containing protein [Candidatus Contendobacter sp.]